MARYQTQMTSVKLPRSALQDHHNALMKAFEARDVDEVNRCMAKHRKITLDSIREVHDRPATRGKSGTKP